MRKMWWIGAILILAFLLRLPFLNGSFWIDEASQALQSMRPLQHQLRIAKDFQPPLYHLVVHVFTRFGADEWWLRLASLIPGLGMIILTYAIGVEFGKTQKEKNAVGIVASTLLALSAFHIFYSQELRQYMLAAFFGTLSWYVLLHMLKLKQKKMWWVAFVFTTTAGLYTMYVYPFLLFSQLIYVVIYERKYLRGFLISLFCSGLLFLPWVPSFLEQLRVGTTLQQSLPGWSSVVSIPQYKALPLVLAKLIGGGKAVDFSLGDLLYFGVPFVFLLILFWKKRRVLHPALICWFSVTLLSAWLISFIIPVVQPKRVLVLLPALYLAIAQGFAAIQTKKFRYLAIGCMIAYQVFAISLLWTTPSLQREEWRGAIQALHRQFSTSDTIAVFGFGEPLAPWFYYEKRFPQTFPSLAFPQVPLRSLSDVDGVMQAVLPYKRVLVFDYLRDLTDPNRLIEAWLESHGYQGVASIDTQNIGFIRVFERVQYVSMGSEEYDS